MSRKLVLAPQTIVTNQSMAADFAITPTELSFQDNVAYQIVVDANLSQGEFKLQGTLDSPDSLGSFAAVTWTDVLDCGTIVGTDDSILVNVNQWPFKYMRLRYVSSVAGTGVCTIKLMARTIGA